ncbi:MAG: hypothetical protein RLZZ22_1037 [Pseudomonadota bacterium]|jgi:protein-tyrosine-phosphatase
MIDHSPIHVLFLCSHNAARSILAEAILNHVGGARFRAFSAGTAPAHDQRPHPLALEALQSAGLDTAGLRSKSWDEFTGPDAPAMDLVITVCDDAHGETCPVWPGHPAIAHWSFPDPMLAQGEPEALLELFKQVMHRMHQRLELFMNLPLASLDRLVLESHAREVAAQH